MLIDFLQRFRPIRPKPIRQSLRQQKLLFLSLQRHNKILLRQQHKQSLHGHQTLRSLTNNTNDINTFLHYNFHTILLRQISNPRRQSEQKVNSVNIPNTTNNNNNILNSINSIYRY